MRTTSLYLALTASLCIAITPTASAQDFPNKPITIVVPNSAATTLDLVARVAAAELSKVLGQAVVVENRTGADGSIGLQYVARQAPADGYTIAAPFVTTLAALPLTVKNLRFDPIKDLPPLIGLVEGRYVLVSSSALPWSNFQQFVEYGKKNPGKVNWGSPTANTRLVTEALVRGLNLQTVYVPYSSGAQFLQALVTGDLHIGFTAEAMLATFGEKFRPIGVTGTTRMPKLPNVPTFIELGQPQIAGLGVSLNLRAGTPAAIIAKLHEAASATLRNPDSRARYAQIGFTPVDEDPLTANKRLQAEATLYADIAKKAGIEPQ